MKNIILISSLVFILSMSGCEKKSTASQTSTGLVTLSDDEASNAKSDINSAMDKLHSALKAKNADELDKLLIDGLFAMTGSDDVFNKSVFVDNMRKSYSTDSTNPYIYDIDRREIIIDKTAGTAIIFEQFKMEQVTPGVSWRLLSHVIKESDGWKFSMLSFTIVPTKDQLPSMMAGLQK